MLFDNIGNLDQLYSTSTWIENHLLQVYLRKSNKTKFTLKLHPLFNSNQQTPTPNAVDLGKNNEENNVCDPRSLIKLIIN